MNEEIIREMIETRRRIHRRPEEGWTEFETTALVVERLTALGGFEILLGTEVVAPEAVMGRDLALVREAEARAAAHGVPASLLERMQGYTGCVGVLETGRSGPVTVFRFDMDCVLVTECDSDDHPPVRLGFASERAGLMHACGHDGHTAVGLGLARWLVEHRDALCGRVKLLFQPAEEGVRGAAAVAASGVVDDADHLIGSHVGTYAGPGEVVICRSGFLASTKLDITFEGQASHAGSDPHKGRSALMAACATAMMMQGIPRHGEGETRVSIGRLVAGEGRNVTPVHAFMQTEVRGETGEVNDYMVEAVRRIVEGNAMAYDVRARMEKTGEATILMASDRLGRLIREVAADVPGVTRISDGTRVSGSEDVTMLIRRVTERGGEGAFFLYGCEHHGHHRADFDIQDESTLPIGLGVMIGVARRLNGV